MGGVRSLARSVPLPFKKLIRADICSRSDGTFGLSRVKWVLSKTMLMTCWTPLPSRQLDEAAFELLLVVGAPAWPGTAAACHPSERAATATSRISRFMPYPLMLNTRLHLRPDRTPPRVMRGLDAV